MTACQKATFRKEEWFSPQDNNPFNEDYQQREQLEKLRLQQEMQRQQLQKQIDQQRAIQQQGEACLLVTIISIINLVELKHGVFSLSQFGSLKH